MKRSFFRLPLPFALLFLLSLAALLTLRTALLRPPPPPPPPPPPLHNATLIALASVDVAEPDLRKAVDDLLDGTLQPHRARLYPFPHYRPRGARLPTRLLRSPKVLPDFRRSLLDWLRRRRYHPDIISHLLPVVKAPIDPAAPRRRYATCAVVGNSGILLRSDRGDAIDAHEFVIRLNNARTEGYARNVGSKTGLSFVNSNILHSCARRDGCYCHPYGDSVPILMYICQPAHLLDYALCNASHRAPLLVTDPRFDLLCARIVKYYSLKRFTEETGRPPEEWRTAHDEKAFHYSSGMQAVMLALGICEQVSVFGFGKAAEAKHHYHSNQKKELDLHDYEAEYALYRDLVERPQVVPFLMDSGFKVPPLVLYH